MLSLDGICFSHISFDDTKFLLFQGGGEKPQLVWFHLSIAKHSETAKRHNWQDEVLVLRFEKFHIISGICGDPLKKMLYYYSHTVYVDVTNIKEAWI